MRQLEAIRYEECGAPTSRCPSPPPSLSLHRKSSSRCPSLPPSLPPSLSLVLISFSCPFPFSHSCCRTLVQVPAKPTLARGGNVCNGGVARERAVRRAFEREREREEDSRDVRQLEAIRYETACVASAKSPSCPLGRCCMLHADSYNFMTSRRASPVALVALLGAQS